MSNPPENMQFAHTKRRRFGQKAQVRRESKNDKTVKIEVKIEANGSKSKRHGGIESMTWMNFAKRQNTANLPKKLRVPAITKTVMTSTRILHVVAVYLAISSMFLTEPYCITSFSFRSSVYQMICSGRMTPRYRWHTGLPKCSALS